MGVVSAEGEQGLLLPSGPLALADCDAVVTGRVFLATSGLCKWDCLGRGGLLLIDGQQCFACASVGVGVSAAGAIFRAAAGDAAGGLEGASVVDEGACGKEWGCWPAEKRPESTVGS